MQGFYYYWSCSFNSYFCKTIILSYADVYLARCIIHFFVFIVLCTILNLNEPPPRYKYLGPAPAHGVELALELELDIVVNVLARGITAENSFHGFLRVAEVAT